MNHGSVSVEMLVNDEACGKLQRFASNLKREESEVAETFTMSMEDLPLFGREISCEGMMFLSRENSNSISLSREASQSFARENSLPVPLTKESSLSFTLEPSIALSRENSLNFNRENSVAVSLGRESSNLEIENLINSADVHDFLREHASIEAKVQVPVQSVENDEAREREFLDTIQHIVTSPTTSDPAAHPTSSSSAFPHSDPHDHSALAASNARRPAACAGAPQTKASRRGLHVKGRPEMQKTARDGAVHWSRQLKLVRAAWLARANQSPEFHSEFQGQIDLSQGRVKSKQECLLRTLQLAAADGLIVPGPFGGGFFGWTRFDVVPGRAGDFRKAMEAMFAEGFREDTLKETFRRSGLVPERWRWVQGWNGTVPWVYNTKDLQ